MCFVARGSSDVMRLDLPVQHALALGMNVNMTSKEKRVDRNEDMSKHLRTDWVRIQDWSGILAVTREINKGKSAGREASSDAGQPAAVPRPAQCVWQRFGTIHCRSFYDWHGRPSRSFKHRSPRAHGVEQDCQLEQLGSKTSDGHH